MLSALLVALGLAGLLLPALPGAPLLFAGLVVAAWAEDFAYVGGGWLALLFVLAALTYAVDFAATALGAKKFGASPRGALAAPRLGSAQRAGFGATLGLALGAVAKLALACAMLGIFAAVRFA